MFDIFMKGTGKFKVSGVSMHIFNKDKYLQGYWDLTAEQLHYYGG